MMRQGGHKLRVPKAKEVRTRELVLAAVQKDGGALQYASHVARADRDFVLAAVRQSGMALAYASDALKAEKKVVLAAVQQQGMALQHASDALKADPEIMLAVVRQLKAEKELALTEVQQDGTALQHVSDALKDDKEVVLAAVRQDDLGQALQYASDALQDDEEVLFVALSTRKSLLDANDANAAIVAALRAELARRPDMVHVLDVDTGETREEPAPKRQRTEVTTSGIKVLVKNAEATNVLLARVKNEKRDAEEGRGAAERRAEDAEDRTKCVSCMVGDLQVCVMPCSHLCVCSGCADDIMSKSGLCPICRGPIRERLTVFISGAG